MEERRKKIFSNNFAVKVKREFLDMFKSSQAISTINENSHFIARDPKVNKAHRRINEFKEEKKEIEEKNYDLIQQIRDLNDKLAKFESIERENEDNIEKLA